MYTIFIRGIFWKQKNWKSFFVAPPLFFVRGTEKEPCAKCLTTELYAHYKVLERWY